MALDIATLPAYMDQLFAVIVENTFTSIPAMAGQLVSGLHRLPYFCFKNKVRIKIKAWCTPVMEAETEMAHSSVSACTSISTGSHLEVCDVSLIEAEEATEEKGTICSFCLCLH